MSSLGTLVTRSLQPSMACIPHQRPDRDWEGLLGRPRSPVVEARDHAAPQPRPFAVLAVRPACDVFDDSVA